MTVKEMVDSSAQLISPNITPTRAVSPVSELLVLTHLLMVLSPLVLLLGVHSALLLLFLLVVYLGRHHNHWDSLGVPSRAPNAVFGNLGPLLRLQTSFAHLLADIHLNPPGDASEPLVGFYIFDRPALVVRDPELIRQLLVKEFSSCPDRHNEAPVGDPMGRANLFSARTPDWLPARRALSPAFSGARLKAMLPTADGCAKIFASRLRQLADKSAGKPVNVRDLAARCITDIMTGCLFGVKGDALSRRDSVFRSVGRHQFQFDLRRALDILGVFVAPQLPLSQLLCPRFFSRRGTTFFRRFFRQLAERQQATGQPRSALPAEPDLFERTLNLHADEPDSEMASAQGAIFFTAGTETTSTAVSCCLFELAANPDVQNRLRQEMIQTLDSLDGEVSYQEIASMTYLDMVIKETLRKYPPLPYLERRSCRAVVLGGVPVETDTPLFVATLGLHHDERFFAQPERFIPERFEREATADRSPYCYAPFGHGPRNCIGMRLGLLAVKLCVVRVLLELEVSLPPGHPTSLQASALALLLAPVGGIPLIVKPVQNFGTARISTMADNR